MQSIATAGASPPSARLTVAEAGPGAAAVPEPFVAETWPLAPVPAAPGAAEACLVAIYPTGPDLGARFDLGGEPVLVGRDGDCGVRLSDPSVSRHHAQIVPAPEGHCVLDLQSTNGTFVNERRAARTPLRYGDTVRVGASVLRYLRSDSAEVAYHEESRRLALTDPLTRLPNRRLLLDCLEREVARHLRHHTPLSVALFDIDHFKQVNDRFGHPAGDHVLCGLAALVRDKLRKPDVLARYGGEEFAVLFPDTPADGAAVVAERLRRLVADHRFCHAGRTLTVTVSLGLASAPGTEDLTADGLIARADDNLYRAKRAGRNRLIA